MMYLLLANLYLCIFYGFYYIFLRRETSFQGNRIYLLAGLLLAFTLPLVEHGEFDNTVVYQYRLPVIQLGDPDTEQLVAGVATAEPRPSIKEYVPIVYLVGCTIAALLVILNMVYTIRGLRKRNPGEAYSFFGIIRIDHAAYGSHKIAFHEQIHAQQWHSADVVILQLVKILNWFNPVVYLYERALKLQHEYIADGKTAADDQMAYAQLLVSRAMGVSGPVLANSFSSKKLLKRRISMLLRDKSPRYIWLRYTVLLPVVVGMIVFSIACNHQGKGMANQTTSEAVTTATGDAKAFKEELGRHVDYRGEAMQNNVQGRLAVTFEKTAGKMEDIRFLNEFGHGQEEEVLKALQREEIAQLAPEGKNLFIITFRISGVEPSDMSPPPPVAAEYTSLGDIVIIGYAPELPPPPPVEPSPSRNGGNDVKSQKDQVLPPKVDQQRAANVEQPEVVEINPDVLFQVVEVNPEPPGGMRAFMEYISKNYDYPQEAIEAEVNGQVQVSFVVERDGSLTDIKVVRDLGHGTGEAAIRVLQSSSKWSPGIQNGRSVRVAYTLPIRLNLQS
ncbi:M56 family metallopeptidase [Parapedobacter tibetensis]|uniref:M56 family metallopeptidase n=1 Tax=Parapedobacter tibetensis TaxID=2972951 RepID=UPI00214DEDC4|nr:M56 family metallopeptidase [Parapedobacter tibetensis]